MQISLVLAILLLTLPLQKACGAPAPSDGPPGSAGSRPPEPALVDLTEDSMIFGPDEKQKNFYGIGVTR